MTDTPAQTPASETVMPEPSPSPLAAVRVGDLAITLDGTALPINGIRQDAGGIAVLIGTDQWMAEAHFSEVRPQS